MRIAAFAHRRSLDEATVHTLHWPWTSEFLAIQPLKMKEIRTMVTQHIGRQDNAAGTEQSRGAAFVSSEFLVKSLSRNLHIDQPCGSQIGSRLKLTATSAVAKRQDFTLQ
jgi:hypothetical protein